MKTFKAVLLGGALSVGALAFAPTPAQASELLAKLDSRALRSKPLEQVEQRRAAPRARGNETRRAHPQRPTPSQLGDYPLQSHAQRFC